ncbi:MAG: ABC transporter permease, partial [Candidatus Thorarchaeota archaeon]
TFVIAAVIAMYLPGLYMVQLQRIIHVSEIGQPTKIHIPEAISETNFWSYNFAFFVTIIFLVTLPYTSTLFGIPSILQLVVVTLILFMASYFGAVTMQLVVGKISGKVGSVLGEKSLYVKRSLGRRKGRFLPLLLILTLSVTTTTMMLVESSSFESTTDNEIAYAFGADLRIESSDITFTNFSQELNTFNMVYANTPVVQQISNIGGMRIFLEGIDALGYAEVGKFADSSFVSNSSEAVLSSLDDVQNGIVLSHSIVELWNRSIGDSIGVYIPRGVGGVYQSFIIVGTMHSAPGFGIAYAGDQNGPSIASALGYQVSQHGFAFVNIEYLTSLIEDETVDLFLTGVNVDSRFEQFRNYLEDKYEVRTFTPHSTYSGLNSESLQEFTHFLSGVRGLTLIGVIVCAIMSVAAIGLFFGSAIAERKPEYAIIRAVGATKRQVTSIVISEFAGLITAVFLVSSILGLVFGYSMSVLLFSISPITPVLPIVITIPLIMALVILLIEWVLMLSACLYPANSAGSTGMIKELRNL